MENSVVVKVMANKAEYEFSMISDMHMTVLNWYLSKRVGGPDYVVTSGTNVLKCNRGLEMHRKVEATYTNKPPLIIYAESNDALDLLYIVVSSCINKKGLVDLKQYQEIGGVWKERDPGALFKKSVVDVFKDSTPEDLDNLLRLRERYKHYIPQMLEIDTGTFINALGLF